MSRELFMLFLVLASVLGGIMGACVWSLHRRDDGDGSTDDKLGDAHRLNSMRSGPASRNPKSADASASSAWQPESVDRHAEAQSRRIVSLVAELQAAEEQQMRLQRDLATLRASRQHGGDSLHPRLLHGEDELPVLNRRVSAYSATEQGGYGSSEHNLLNGDSGSELLGLSLAMDSTAEIPVMSEEELAESIDELELEFIGESSGSAARDKTHA